MARNNKKKRGNIVGLIEYLNMATSYQTKSSTEAKKDIKDIKQQARSNGWQKQFSKLVAENPNWVELAMDRGVKYLISKDGREKGVFPRVLNGTAVLKVVM